ncbi:MAG: argininosuccinate lyase [Candidatus Omnitrophica bacterium]|nr:argininosuccinate lyase [Candidatus Omnitrophota bacterium]MBU1924695.1 argininosuccinate lyase [Candidatus Omnitrophota bacterium]
MAKKLWGGRFKKKIDRDFEEFSKSVQYDYKLAEFDTYHSLIHAQALTYAGIITKKEADKISAALKMILRQVKAGKFKPDSSAEDIHTQIHNRVQNQIGHPAAKLHSLRSRNDQVVFGEKLYCMTFAKEILGGLSSLLKNVKSRAAGHKNCAFIGYTHTRRAQVILFGQYLQAYISMFQNDADRIDKFLHGLTAYIGAGALAGTSITKQAYAKAIGAMGSFIKEFNVKVAENALDNVSGRDFIVEFLSILSIVQMHLSRLSEDLILYSTKEFGFVDLPEEFCTGSSLMPHKKNPDFLELVRGYTGRIYGNLISVLTMMKGLPLSYNRDMQLDKEPLFSSVEIVSTELKIMAKFIGKLKLNKLVIEKALEDESLYATELAEYLVVKEKVAFGDAHDLVGKLIRYSEDKNSKIKSMSDEELSRFHKSLNKKVVNKAMNAKYAVESKKSISRKVPKIKNA